MPELTKRSFWMSVTQSVIALWIPTLASSQLPSPPECGISSVSRAFLDQKQASR